MSKTKTLSCCPLLFLTVVYFTATCRAVYGYSADSRDAVGSVEVFQGPLAVAPEGSLNPAPVPIPAPASVRSQSVKIDMRNEEALIGLSESALAAATTEQKLEMIKRLIARANTPRATESGADPLQAMLEYGITRILRSEPDTAGFDRLYFRLNQSQLDRALGPRELARLINEQRTPPVPGDWDGLDRYLDSVTGTSGSGKNRIHFLIDGPEVISAVTEAIDAAKSSIHLAVFQYQADKIGWGLARKLARAASRGVKVRVLLDEFGSDALNNEKVLELIAYLRSNSIEVTIKKMPFTLGHLDHRKILVIDGAIGFTGGMNIGVHYQVDWHDQQTRIEGPAVARLQDAFLERWQAAGGRVPLGEELYPKLQEFPDGAEIRVIPHSGGQDQNIKAMYLRAIGAAQNSVKIANPYFVDSDIVQALIQAAGRGVKVQLVLPQENNITAVQLASRAFYPDLLKAEVEIYEYQSRMAHLKVVVIDGRWATCGSSNLDTRSFKNNDELNIVVNDIRFAQEIETRLFAVDISKSRHILTYTSTPQERQMRNLEGWL